MQLGDPSVLETSSGEPVMAVTATAASAEEGANGGDLDADSGEEKGRELGVNRWPRQETLALLKIRSDMDSVFRASSLKGPLWEEVSRKLAELGYHRSAKKCKEKFENVYKYHKRTKGNRSGKPEGKIYKFFDQLQALENQLTVSNYPPKQPQPTLATTTTSTVTLPTRTRPSDITTVPSTNPTAIISPSLPPPSIVTNPRNIPSSQPFSLPNMNLFSTTTSTSSSTASDDDLEQKQQKKKRKYWKDYFRRLTRQVLEKQEEMHNKFLEAMDKKEREHVAQREAWRMQEMARTSRDHEILVQERSSAAARDAAFLAFLHKLCGTTNPTQVLCANLNFLQQPPPPPLPPPPSVSQVQPQSQQQQQQQQQQQVNFEIEKLNSGQRDADPLVSSSSSSSRWPKAEVHALIRLRTSLEARYQENGPKAPLWEDISIGMQRLGYNRSAKRCKEKWENINKYFKKMKESNKKRREDSKTCPYYHELEALYNEKGKITHNLGTSMMEPLMVQPEQQWRPPQNEREREEEIEEGIDDNDEENGGESVEDDEGDSGRYKIATNKLSPVDTVE